MLKKFQNLLKEKQIDYYLIPTDDDHQSENVSAYYQTRAFLSGFTGSAGTLLVTPDKAYLWTDGRYFIQAEKQLKEGIQLMKMGQKNVPTLKKFLIQHIHQDEVLAFDGQTMNCQFVIDLKNACSCAFHILTVDLFQDFWQERPERPHEKAYLYDIQYHGLSTHEKIKLIQDKMKEEQCSYHLLTTLDDIAWIFNIRGTDIPCSPTVLAFSLITLKESYLYLQKEAYDQELVKAYQQENVIIKEYSQIYDDILTLDDTILVNLSQINYQLYQNIHTSIINKVNPSQFLKAIKNDIEIKNTKNAHLKDAIAMTKFMYWLKNLDPQTPIDELSVSDKVLEFRQQQALFTQPSFTTICAWNQNAALMHYHATHNDYSPIQGDGLLLIDSGGQYLYGTTDITRTYALGTITPKQKKHFTMVLKGMLALQNAHFLYGCTGQNLDILAREPIWNENIDYQCGTGHGVGHFLNVHEGPHGIRPRARFQNEFTPFEAGMIVTDEPGIYLENEYGIRIENELLCIKGQENEYGQFLHFDVLTYVPIDLDAIDANILTYQEKTWLNEYHQDVYNKVSPYLNSQEKEWLKQYTRAI